MKIHSRKDSNYDIEPWNQQQIKIPSYFLHTNNFAKTGIASHFNNTSQKGIQIGINSVYFIKNQQQQSQFCGKKKNRYHRTTQSSPRINHNNAQEQVKTKQQKSKTLNSRLSTSKISKQQSKRQQNNIMVSHKKDLIFQLKTLKRKTLDGKRKTNFIGEQKIMFHQNLLKIYERSTIGSDLRKNKLQKKQIDEICLKKNLKTQVNNETETAKLIVNTQNNLQTQINDKLFLDKSLKQSNKNVPSLKKKLYLPQATQKLKFELLMERKLFLFKNKFDNSHNSNLSHSKIKS